MDAIEYLKSVATVEACRGGYEFKVERSDISEATYVKVRRDETAGGCFGPTTASPHPPTNSDSLSSGR